MEEKGIITEISGNIATIKLSPKSECKACGVCSGSMLSDARLLRLRTETPLQIGQTVRIKINQNILTLTYIILYAIPLSGFIIGTLIGYIIGKEPMAILLGLTLLIIDIFVAKFTVKKIKAAENVAQIISDEND